MSDLVGNPEDRFSHFSYTILDILTKTKPSVDWGLIVVKLYVGEMIGRYQGMWLLTFHLFHLKVVIVAVDCKHTDSPDCWSYVKKRRACEPTIDNKSLEPAIGGN